MNKQYPFISVILNTYNEEANIARCLSLIRKQNYPQKNIEIILIDDYSCDKTVTLAKPYDVIVVNSGYKNRERSKSIGIQHAKGELFLMMDADVFLLSDNYIRRCVELLAKYPTAVAVQSIRWHYRKSDYIINRYCNLFGISDPTMLFLGKRGSLMATETDWPNKNTIIHKGTDYYVVNFTPQNLPTVGAIGYMVRKNALLKTRWKPYFFHLDTAYELVAMGSNQFIMTKLEVEHLYVHSLGEYFQKQARNLNLFLKLKNRRKYTYQMPVLQLIGAVLLMITLIYPLFQSVKGYMKKPDSAWFLHPLFCFALPMMYLVIIVRENIRKTI